MSFISRVRKLILNEEASEEIEKTLGDGAEDGLFMATGRQAGGLPQEGEQAIEMALAKHGQKAEIILMKNGSDMIPRIEG